ncbi:MAG TPA: bifunctional 4-hydroxy-2-oxoglutarate aldolase/2-dehydro-3-deoxy-phosphogluconate aldolase [Kofleriaceae bacterium]|nr:bifunctional 4-hydroxy-2-oxoglutarate aldolase/2-dehydro-3-deoxy-phosphogluconate aldolase [Kofleriaceae bacterium]
MTAAEFLQLLAEVRGIAIVRAPTAEQAALAMEAAIRGGIRVAEFTLNTPGALDLIRDFAARPGVVVGAGTVLDMAHAEEALHAGARFLVAPVVDDEVIAVATRHDIACIPGAATPTEMWKAHRAGAPLVKVFPAPPGGPEAIRAVLGPMPFLRLVPTHGVTVDNAGAYLAAGAYALGFVRSLFDPAEMAAGRWELVEQRARALVAAIAAANVR